MNPPTKVKQELIQQWLDKAEQDLQAAIVLLSEDEPLLGIIGFHAQQAAEKFLKALLVHQQIEFPKHHNLGELLDLVAKFDHSLADALRGVTALNPYGVEIRYPGDLPEMNQADAQEAIKLAQKVREAIYASLQLSKALKQ